MFPSRPTSRKPDDHGTSGAHPVTDGSFTGSEPSYQYPAGIYSAVRQYSKGDYAVVTASFLSSSIPGFFLSLLLVYIFNIKLKLLPSSGMITLGGSGGIGDLAATW